MTTTARRRADRDRDRGSVCGGALALIVGIRTMIDPGALDPSSLSEVLGGSLIYVWAALYGVGGLLIVLGGLLRRSEAEEPGLLLFIAGMFVNAIAILSVRHFWGAMVTLAPYVPFVWIAVGRIRDLRRARAAVSRIAHEDFVFVPVLPALFATGTGDLVVTLIVAVLGSGFASAAFAYVGQRRAAKDAKGLTQAQENRLKAETGSIIDERWQRYVSQLEKERDDDRDRIAELEAKVETLEEREDRLEKENGELRKTIETLERGGRA